MRDFLHQGPGEGDGVGDVLGDEEVEHQDEEDIGRNDEGVVDPGYIRVADVVDVRRRVLEGMRPTDGCCGNRNREEKEQTRDYVRRKMKQNEGATPRPRARASSTRRDCEDWNFKRDPDLVP